MAEHLAVNQGVVGSSPTFGATFWTVGRVVMQRIANPYNMETCCVGSNPTLSATCACSSTVEQGTHNPLAVGSNPAGRTTLSFSTLQEVIHMEIWKPVVGLEDRYMISNTGRCKRKARSFVNSKGHTVHIKELQMKPTVDEYVEFVLKHPDKKQHCHTAHRMVAEAFLPNPMRPYIVTNSVTAARILRRS